MQCSVMGGQTVGEGSGMGGWGGGILLTAGFGKLVGAITAVVSPITRPFQRDTLPISTPELP